MTFINVNVMMPQGVEKATKSPDCAAMIRRSESIVGGSEDTGRLSGLFENGECLIELCGRMF